MPVNNIFFNKVLETVIRWKSREMKGKWIEKEQIKLFLFVDDLILYREYT